VLTSMPTRERSSRRATVGSWFPPRAGKRGDSAVS